MKAVILAAGQGTRLKPLTNTVPKCMVKFKGKMIIDHILTALRNAGIQDIAIVKGYKAKVLNRKKTTSFINPKFDSTNMVYSLFCSEEFWYDDLIISYSDIVYTEEIVKKLINCVSDISVVVDNDWLDLWQKRMSNPLSDAETLKLNENNEIIELGKKPNSYDEIEAQYIGLIKIKKEVLFKVKDFYYSLDKTAFYDGKDFENMYMTTFIQLIIEELMPVKAVRIDGGWVEIDSLSDLKNLS